MEIHQPFGDNDTGYVTGTGNPNEIAYFTGASSIGSLAVATYPSLTELSYLKGTTSSIQTQFTGTVKTDQTVGQTIGATGARLTKLWATDITVTNAITGSVTGNAGTVTNGVYTNIANSMSLINPLTTLAESWIGPSSTTGIYFKGGNVGIGTTGPSQMLTVGNNNQFTVTSAGALTASSLSSDGGLVHSDGFGTFFANSVRLQDGNNLYWGSTPMIGAVANSYLSFSVNSSEKMRVLVNGNVGIGTTSPTAYLHLKAGVAGASSAPLKFTSGTLQTTAEVGAIEYDGTHYFATPTGTLRERIPTGWNAGGTATAGTTTTVTDARAKTTSTIFIQPTSAGFAGLSNYISTKNNGSFVITTTIALGTETFDYLVIN